MATSDLHVVLGATGGIGRALVHELADQGRRVRAVSRRVDPDLPAGVEAVVADVATRDGARSACAGAAVVHHCAQPAYHRWSQDFPALNEAVLAAAAAAGAKLVLADNLYAYAPPTGPITEHTPQRPTSRKGALRLRLAERLLDAHRRGEARVTIGRASDYYGPGTTASTAGETVFGAVLAGRTVRWPGRVDVPHALHHLPDIARGLIALADHDTADGRAWILPAAPALTPRELVERIGAAAGRPARISANPKVVLRLVGLVDRAAGELPDIWYQYDRPWTVDDGQFQRTFGPRPPTAWVDGITATVDWYRSRGPVSTRS